MEDKAKCVMTDWESEYHAACELNKRMSNEIQDMKGYFEEREMKHKQEAAIMNAKLEMVYLIFGRR